MNWQITITNVNIFRSRFNCGGKPFNLLIYRKVFPGNSYVTVISVVLITLSRTGYFSVPFVQGLLPLQL